MSEKAERYFPKELLNGSIAERKNYFKNFFVLHKKLKEAIEHTVNIIDTPNKEKIVFVLGPSGVGKKELIRLTKEKLIERLDSNIIENPGCIPVVDVEAEAPEKGSFDFPALWKSVLEKMPEPMIRNKCGYEDTYVNNSNGNIFRVSRIKRKADYFDVVHKTTKSRGTIALFIDEAHHMLKSSSGKNLNWSVDLIKSFTNLSQTTVALVGTYELTTYLDLNISSVDQVIQRTRIVEFPRYKLENEDIQTFGNIAKLLLLHMPLEKTSEDLVDKDWMYFYKHSLGCVGTLKKWFTDAYSIALDSGEETLTMGHLEKTKIPGKLCVNMLESIEKGERKLKSIQSDGDIDIQLGFKKSKNEELPVRAQNNEGKIRPAKNKKVFERKIGRDLVKDRQPEVRDEESLEVEREKFKGKLC